MPILELALLLAVAGVAAFPCWRYSAKWNYWPSASAGVLLLIVAIVAAAGSPGAPDNRASAPSRPGLTTAAAVVSTLANEVVD